MIRTTFMRTSQFMIEQDSDAEGKTIYLVKGLDGRIWPGHYYTAVEALLRGWEGK